MESAPLRLLFMHQAKNIKFKSKQLKLESKWGQAVVLFGQMSKQEQHLSHPNHCLFLLKHFLWNVSLDLAPQLEVRPQDP